MLKHRYGTKFTLSSTIRELVSMVTDISVHRTVRSSLSFLILSPKQNMEMLLYLTTTKIYISLLLVENMNLTNL